MIYPRWNRARFHRPPWRPYKFVVSGTLVRAIHVIKHTFLTLALRLLGHPHLDLAL